MRTLREVKKKFVIKKFELKKYMLATFLVEQFDRHVLDLVTVGVE